MRWYTLLETFGKTPQEWAEMENYQRKYLEHAHAEVAERREEQRENQSPG